MAIGLRAWHLGRPSLWYDEVVSMRLARQPDVAGVLDLLGRIDATRAPLHPLILHAWLALFGPSDLAGRAFSAACGVLTVGVVARIGRSAFDRPTALWAAWLAAVSPVLVRYSQEVRMYALLTFLTCLAWWLLLGNGPGTGRRRLAALAVTMAAIAYTHPLGLLMNATLLSASVPVWRWGGRGAVSWGLVHGAWILAILPWLPRYLDHGPEWTAGRPGWKTLLGMPIEFVGGDAKALAACLLVIGLGALRFDEDRRLRLRGSPSWWLVLAWLLTPPLVLFAYSRWGHPLFGPSRYMMFVAPAYLLLLGRGLARLPIGLAMPLAAGGLALSLAMLGRTTYAEGAKADWRVASAWLRRERLDAALVVYAPPGLANLEVQVARYYLPGATIRPSEGAVEVPTSGVLAVGTGWPGDPAGSLARSPSRPARIERFPGLWLFIASDPSSLRDRPSAPGPEDSPDRPSGSAGPPP